MRHSMYEYRYYMCMHYIVMCTHYIVITYIVDIVDVYSSSRSLVYSIPRV
jgi:hypothetical protein